MLRCPKCAVPYEEGHRFCFACGSELGSPERAEEDPLIGRTLPGGYRVTHLVGVGGMGRVYCAEQVTLGRTVAVKVVHPSFGEEEQTAARFLNEARAASRLSHPNSVAIYDFGRTDDKRPYIVMEYLRGRDLARLVAEDGPLPLARMVGLLRQTLAALEEAHALGIVHRDLKPDNLVIEPMRSGRDFVKVVDFGLAKILDGDSKESGGRALTRPGLVCGTPDYMSPEQARADSLDGRSDLYSVGVILYELLAGRVPFESDSATTTLLMHLTEAPADPRQVAPDRNIPAAFAAAALRSLSKAPDDRFQSAREFADALASALLEVEGGASGESATTGIRCRACGALNPLDQKFCGECGVPTTTVPPPLPGRLPLLSLTPASAHGATIRAPAAASVDASVTDTLPLLGREDAIAWLEGRHHQAGVVLAVAHLVGEAGMGKTRLVAEMLGRWSAAGDVVANTGPDPSWAKIGDYALRRAIRALAGFSEETPAASAWNDAGPEARSGLAVLFAGTERPSSRDGADRRATLAEALRWALDRAAQRATSGIAVLAVDDLDFIDGTSRNAFVDVMLDPPAAPALMVVTYAPGARLVSGAMPDETWSVGPLPYDSFADRLSPKLSPPGVALAPLHLQELIAWSQESNEPPPERLAEVIARRTERLPPDARQALYALAVWGDDATPQTLRPMLRAGIDIDATLDTLGRARMVAVDNRGIRILHPLIRRVVFSSIPAGRKQELYAGIHDLRPDAPLDVRAKQAMHAGSSLEALSLLDALSMRRAAQGDVQGSVGALRHALDLARRELHRGELDDPETAVLVFARKLAEALLASGKRSDAEGVLREALGTAPPASVHRGHLLAVLEQLGRTSAVA
jgi:serine/threonine-protein kinase